MSSGILANAHDFVIQQANMAENVKVYIDTQVNISNQTKEPLSPVKGTTPCTSQNFTGQEIYLERLHKHFSPTMLSGDSKRKLFLLHGMGGIGKTQITLKFKDEMEDHFSHIFWIDATSEDTVTQSLKDVHKTHALGGSFSSATVLNWISSLTTEWLIIFDNADGSPELVETFLPPGNRGNILITSRNPAVRRITTPRCSMEVTEMSEDTSIKLLLKATGLDEGVGTHQYRDILKEIVIKMHYLPLAIDQAGAYITAGKCSLHSYVGLYDRHRRKLMDNKTFRGASKYSKTVYGTWEVSYQKIVEMSKNEEDEDISAAARGAMNIINICAFFHHEKISEEIFEKAAINYLANIERDSNNELHTLLKTMDQELLYLDEEMEWDELRFRESMEILSSFSLIKQTINENVFAIHPLVQTWCQDRLSLADKKIWVNNGKGLITSSILVDIGETAYIHSILLHVVQNISHGNRLNDRTYYDDAFKAFARILKINGKYMLEEELRSSIVDMHLQVLGEEHSATIHSMINLASTYLDRGSWNEAEELQTQVMKTSILALGQEHPYTLRCMADLASAYSYQGKWSDAEELQLLVMEIRTKIFHPEHSSVLSITANLATTYIQQGKWTEAEKLQRMILELTTNNYGEENPETLKVMSNLATALQKQERLEEAENLQVQVMEIRTRVLGREHPDTLAIMSNLSITYSNQGRLGEAEMLQKQVLEMRIAVLGQEHPHTLITMCNLASTYRDQGKLMEAESLEVETLDMSIRILGEEHPDTLNIMDNLSDTYWKQGKWPEAEELQIHSARVKMRILGEEHPGTLMTMGALARTYMSQGKF